MHSRLIVVAIGLVISGVIAFCLAVISLGSGIDSREPIDVPTNGYSLQIVASASYDDISVRQSFEVTQAGETIRSRTLCYMAVSTWEEHANRNLLVVFPEDWDGFYIINQSNPTEILGFFDAQADLAYPLFHADLLSRYPSYAMYQQQLDRGFAELCSQLQTEPPITYTLAGP